MKKQKPSYIILFSTLSHTYIHASLYNYIIECMCMCTHTHMYAHELIGRVRHTVMKKKTDHATKQWQGL